jgi:TatD DNase family protein
VIDFHCHLDLYPDPHAIARECVARGLYILSVTTTPSAWAGTAALAHEAPRIRTALGLHPQIAHERKGELPLFERLLPDVRYVGEIGLDGGPEYKRHWQDQVFVFTRILELCAGVGGRVLTIHSRRAAVSVLDALEAHPGAGTPILHWFSGTQRELARAVDLDCWFSVGPAMLASEKGRALAAEMPRDRLLTETDGPFAQLEGRAVLPWDAERAIALLADMWAEPEATVRDRLTANLRRLGMA